MTRQEKRKQKDRLYKLVLRNIRLLDLVESLEFQSMNDFQQGKIALEMRRNKERIREIARSHNRMFDLKKHLKAHN